MLQYGARKDFMFMDSNLQKKIEDALEALKEYWYHVLPNEGDKTGQDLRESCRKKLEDLQSTKASN